MRHFSCRFFKKKNNYRFGDTTQTQCHICATQEKGSLTLFQGLKKRGKIEPFLKKINRAPQKCRQQHRSFCCLKIAVAVTQESRHVRWWRFFVCGPSRQGTRPQTYLGRYVVVEFFLMAFFFCPSSQSPGTALREEKIDKKRTRRKPRCRKRAGERYISATGASNSWLQGQRGQGKRERHSDRRRGPDRDTVSCPGPCRRRTQQTRPRS